MKNKRNICLLNLILSFALLLTAYSATQAQAKPDLIITDASMTTQKRGDYVYQITLTITIANYCHETTASEHDLEMNLIPDDPEVTIYTIHREVPSLKGGQSLTMTVKINKNDGGLPYFRDPFLNWLKETGKLPRTIFRLDGHNKVKEADEKNNWRQLNPNEAPPKLGGQYQCSPKV